MSATSSLLRRSTLWVGAVVAALAIWAGSNALMNTRQRVEVAQALTQGDSARAPEIMRRYGCAGCHTVRGLAGADGQVGGPLSDIRKRVYIAGVVNNDADNLVKWIVDPQALSPRSAMPKTGITETEARDVAAYLYAQ